MTRLDSIGGLAGWLVTESAVYGLVASLLTGLVVLAIWAVGVAVSWVSGSFRPLAVARRLSAICGAALILGAPANLIFTASMRYRFYIPGDPLADWLPYIPSGAWLIDPEFGGRFMNGGSPALLWGAWAMLAVPVWGGAVLAERRLCAWLATLPPPLPTRSSTPPC